VYYRNKSPRSRADFIVALHHNDLPLKSKEEALAFNRQMAQFFGRIRAGANMDRGILGWILISIVAGVQR
jgi:hypothetical protein